MFALRSGLYEIENLKALGLFQQEYFAELNNNNINFANSTMDYQSKVSHLLI
jgi:hypothetical protein